MLVKLFKKNQLIFRPKPHIFARTLKNGQWAPSEVII